MANLHKFSIFRLSGQALLRWTLSTPSASIRPISTEVLIGVR